MNPQDALALKILTAPEMQKMFRMLRVCGILSLVPIGGILYVLAFRFSGLLDSSISDADLAYALATLTGWIFALYYIGWFIHSIFTILRQNCHIHISSSMPLDP